MFSTGISAFVVPERPAQARVGCRRVFQQFQQKCRIVTRQADHPLAFNHALRLVEGSLHDELVKRHTQQTGCLLQRVVHVLRHPGHNAAPFTSRQGHGYSQRVRDFARIVAAESRLRISVFIRGIVIICQNN